MSATEERGEADGAGFARGDRARRGAARAASRERGAFRDGSFPCVCCGRRRDGCASRRRDRRRERARGRGRGASRGTPRVGRASHRVARPGSRLAGARLGRGPGGRGRATTARATWCRETRARRRYYSIRPDDAPRVGASRRVATRFDAARRGAADPARVVRRIPTARRAFGASFGGDAPGTGTGKPSAMAMSRARAIKRKHANRSRREARKTRREASREGCGPGGARGGGRGHGHGGGRHLGTEVGAVGGVRRPCGGRVQRWPRGAATVGFYRDLRSPESRAARRSRRGVSTG